MQHSLRDSLWAKRACPMASPLRLTMTGDGPNALYTCHGSATAKANMNGLLIAQFTSASIAGLKNLKCAYVLVFLIREELIYAIIDKSVLNSLTVP